jgi:hypothetical protein
MSPRRGVRAAEEVAFELATEDEEYACGASLIGHGEVLTGTLTEAFEADDFLRASGLVGRNYAPDLLVWLLWRRRIRDLATLRTLLPDASSGAEFPEHCLPRWVWLRLFEAVGFTSDTGRRRPR